MARKSYEVPKVDIIIGQGGGAEIKGGVVMEGSGTSPLDTTQASFSAWRMAVQNANLDIDQSYAGYVDWMVKNGYAAYIQPDDSEFQ